MPVSVSGDGKLAEVTETKPKPTRGSRGKRMAVGFAGIRHIAESVSHLVFQLLPADGRLARLEAEAESLEAKAELAEKEAVARKRINDARVRISNANPSRAVNLPSPIRKHWSVIVILVVVMFVASFVSNC